MSDHHARRGRVSAPTLQGLRLAPVPHQGCVRRELSRDALTIIEIHEAQGGRVDVRRTGERVAWRIDGGPEMTALDASIELARLRKAALAVHNDRHRKETA